MVKVRLQADGRLAMLGQTPRYEGALHAFRTVVREEGFLALYKGVGPRLSRVCCEVAITMSLYGEVVKMLNKYWITSDMPEHPNYKGPK